VVLLLLERVVLLFTEGAEDERDDVPALLLRVEVRAELLLLTVPELRGVDELRPFTLDERDGELLLLTVPELREFDELRAFTLDERDEERDVVAEFFSEELLPELRYSPFSRVVAREEDAFRVEVELRPEAADERKPALLRPDE
jgi:hypothetical protein